MKVLFLPADKNPYQNLLAESLAPFGIIVTYNSGLIQSLYWLIKNRKQLEIIHFHWPHRLYRAKKKWLTPIQFPLFIISLCFARLFGYSIIWTMHNIYPHKKSPLIDFMGQFFLVLISNAIIVHCSHARNEISRLFLRKNDVFVIPHGNYIIEYLCKKPEGEARHDLGIGNDQFVFLFFGNIHPYKNVEKLIEEFIRLKRNDCFLLIAGQCRDHKLKSNIIQLAHGHENIRLVLEYIPDDLVYQYFQAADVLVAPFQNILTSGSVILGLSFGKPIIAPALGCLPELINSEIGLLYEPDNREGLFEAMVKIQEINTRLMGEKAYELAKSLDWEDIGKKTKEVYWKCRNK